MSYTCGGAQYATQLSGEAKNDKKERARCKIT